MALQSVIKHIFFYLSLEFRAALEEKVFLFFLNLRFLYFFNYLFY